MADGRWSMTEQELNNVTTGFDISGRESLPHHGEHKAVDDREGGAARRCAFCGSDQVIRGTGGYGEGFGYRSLICRECGGITDFVYKDNVGRFF